MLQETDRLNSNRLRLLGLLVIGLVICLPGLLVHYPDTYDTLFAHMAFRSFSSQFFDGELYPRWLYDFYNGYGAPMFYYYPPLLFYFESLLDGLTFRALPDLLVLGLTACVLITASGLACFYWLRDVVGSKAAFLPAALYMVLPNHLAIDFYLKGTLTELSAYLWLPLLFLFIRRSFDNRVHWITVALSYAALITSTVPMAVGFTPVLLFFIGYEVFIRAQADGGIKPRYFLPLFGLIAGFCLAGFHIITAYLLTDIINPEKFWVGFYDPRTWFMCFFDCSASSGANLSLSFSRLHIIEFLTIASIFAFCWKSRAKRRLQALFWLIIAAGTIFMMSEYSILLWDHVPLLERIQFPWRLAVALDLALCFLLALALPIKRSEIHAIAACACFCLFSFSVFSIVQSAAYLNKAPLYSQEEGEELMAKSGYYNVYIPAYTDVTRTQLLAADPPALIRSENADGDIEALEYTDIPYGKRFVVNSEAPVTVRIRQLHYPTWRAYSEETGAHYTLKFSEPMGDIVFDFAGGQDTIVLKHTMSQQEKIGWGFTIVTLLVMLGSLVSYSLRPKKKP